MQAHALAVVGADRAVRGAQVNADIVLHGVTTPTFKRPGRRRPSGPMITGSIIWSMSSGTSAEVTQVHG